MVPKRGVYAGHGAGGVPERGVYAGHCAEHSRRGCIPTPEGVRRGWSPSAASMQAIAQGMVGATFPPQQDCQHFGSS